MVSQVDRCKERLRVFGGWVFPPEAFMRACSIVAII